jgi:pimeloyl-ACP methyl ester carboxylesterase
VPQGPWRARPLGELAAAPLPGPAQLGREVVPNLVRFNEVAKGGHFVAWEEPELFVAEMRAAFSSLRE